MLGDIRDLQLSMDEMSQDQCFVEFRNFYTDDGESYADIFAVCEEMGEYQLAGDIMVNGGID